MVLFMNRDLGSACDAFRRALAAKPEDSTKRRHLSVALLARGALDRIERINESARDQPRVRFYRARALDGCGRREESDRGAICAEHKWTEDTGLVPRTVSEANRTEPEDSLGC